MKRRHRYITLSLAATLVVCLAVGAVWVFLDPVLDAAGRFLVTEDEIQPSDLLFVPSGNPRLRFQKAIDLLRAGAADRILINLEKQTESDKIWEKRYGQNFSALRVILHMMAVDHIPVDRVTITDQRAVSTKEDFEILKERVAAENIESVIVVTSGTHLRRCRLMTHRILGEQANIRFVAADTPAADHYTSRSKRAIALFIWVTTGSWFRQT